MKFDMVLEEKDVEMIAWLLQTRSKTHMQILGRILFVTIIVIGALLYDIFFYDERTKTQWMVLSVLAVICVIKSVLTYRGMIDYLKIAKKRTKPILKKKIRYVFSKDGIQCETGLKENFISWRDVKEWGKYKEYIFIMLRSNEAIILNQDRFEASEILQLKALLAEKIGKCAEM